jgi:hypothetical protein
VTKDELSVDRTGPDGFPTAIQTSIEQIIGSGLSVPDGDRRHDSESSTFVTDPVTMMMREKHIMTVLILSDRIGREEQRRLLKTPIQGMLDRAMFGNLFGKERELVIGHSAHV